jgi:hypothetical protein
MARRVDGSDDMKELLISLAALVLVSTSSPPDEQTAATGGTGVETLVSVGSPSTPFSQNKQLEPAVAIDPAHPTIVVAAARDQVDMPSCDAGDPATCPIPAGIGFSGAYFSFDAGATWRQPTYEGWSARDCLGPGACAPHVGPIGTVPGFFEQGLRSAGRVSVAFGPVPSPTGEFSWSNGSRLYFSTVVEKLPGLRGPFLGGQAIAVTSTDDVAAAANGDASAWTTPTIVTRQERGFALDEGALVVDDAASSPHFGNVYVCATRYSGDWALVASVSNDGGATWTQSPVPRVVGGYGCILRTDSQGVVYLFGARDIPDPPHALLVQQIMFRSFDGGQSWEGPTRFRDVVAACSDPYAISGVCTWDGVAGVQVAGGGISNPTIDVANGSPSGEGATDVIYRTWVDGRDGLNHEHVLLSYSSDGGTSWSDPRTLDRPGDRGLFASVALSPDGTDAFVVYEAFTTPFRRDTSKPRGIVAVVLHSDLDADGAPIGFTEIYRGAEGDPRGGSFNSLGSVYLGEFISSAATNSGAIAVWTDLRNAAHCPAIDDWRGLLLRTDDPPGPPSPGQACPAAFGNSDIYGATAPDPSP